MGPCKKHGELVRIAQYGIMSSIAVIKVEGDIPQDYLDSLDEELDAQDSRVQGNRSDEVPVTWEDLRLCLLSTLKYAVAFLEAPRK